MPRDSGLTRVDPAIRVLVLPDHSRNLLQRLRLVFLGDCGTGHDQRREHCGGDGDEPGKTARATHGKSPRKSCGEVVQTPVKTPARLGGCAGSHRFVQRFGNERDGP
ncbi:hypothetical protein [Saccharothrix coeruleofusca]|uniref:hypothetical protein n=1 Tax=Saccharothrix coeruleofusca TaxID=33919 RepID=UPI001E30489C|nr:hypothetical protein [Saccharothrix coeruleofusca]